jgi:hypothetical protein
MGSETMDDAELLREATQKPTGLMFKPKPGDIVVLSIQDAETILPFITTLEAMITLRKGMNISDGAGWYWDSIYAILPSCIIAAEEAVKECFVHEFSRHMDLAGMKWVYTPKTREVRFYSEEAKP